MSVFWKHSLQVSRPLDPKAQSLFLWAAPCPGLGGPGPFSGSKGGSYKTPSLTSRRFLRSLVQGSLAPDFHCPMAWILFTIPRPPVPTPQTRTILIALSSFKDPPTNQCQTHPQLGSLSLSTGLLLGPCSPQHPSPQISTREVYLCPFIL